MTLLRNALLTLLISTALVPAATWQSALEKMPLGLHGGELNRTNCVDVMLRAFQSNHIVKALIFMPGATDEFYMFRRARAQVTNATPTLLDAVQALTNQTLIRATFRAPLLLLHTDEDPVEPLIVVQDQAAANKVRSKRFVPYAIYNDRDWNVIQPALTRQLNAEIRPQRYTYDLWHFYRHSFAAWNLTGWEALEAIALAGKTRLTIARKPGLSFRVALITFEGDERVRATPKFDVFPR